MRAGKQNARSMTRGVLSILGLTIGLSIRHLGKLLTLSVLLKAPIFAAGVILGFLQQPKTFVVVGVIYGLLAGPLLAGSGIFIVSSQVSQTVEALVGAVEAASRRHWQFLLLWLIGIVILLACAGPGLLVGALGPTSALPGLLPVPAARTVAEVQPLLYLCGAVAAFWVFSVYAPAVPALFLEGLDAWTALRRGRELSRGHRWRITGVVLGLLAIIFLLYLAFAPVARAVSAIDDEVNRRLLFVVLTFLRGGASFAVVSAGWVSLYEHLVSYQMLVARESDDDASA